MKPKTNSPSPAQRTVERRAKKAKSSVIDYGDPKAAQDLLPLVYEELRRLPKDTRDCVQALADLYDAWDKTEPRKVRDARSAEWKAELAAAALPAPEQKL